ncbi:MAG: TspO/MBR family protein [bacterium]|nr:TspO/MBR family protein [bacterium]
MKSKGASFSWGGVIVSIVIAQLAGVIGAFYTMPAVKSWYPTLTQPSINPPSWVFAPVWIILYTLMGIAAYLVFKTKTTKANRGWVEWGLTLYVVQLVLNAWWSILFFGQHRLFEATIEIMALWIVILVTLIMFAKVKPLAGWLLLPYLGWVTFATYLSYAYWLLNG